MRQRRTLLTLLLALAMVTVPLATSGVAAPTTAPSDSGVSAEESFDSTATTQEQDSAPPDPEEDVLGWENGYWHNESVSVTRGDGLNQSELDAVVARGMARVEHIRRLEFEGVPPVEVISREEFAADNEQRFANVTEGDRLRHNTKYEALFMVNESQDSLAVEQSNQAGGVGGFYDPAANEIKIVSENTTTPKLDEITLSQELFHALQDQKFNISAYDQSTRELHNARDGIIEGDGNYVDQLYQQECEGGAWNGTCLLPGEQGAPEGFDPHFGLYQITFQPYSTGPRFVRDIHQSEGWDAVNEIYENPPASTEQTIHADKYGTDEPVNVTVEDTSQDPWRQLELNESNPDVPYAQFGEGGLFVALWYPGFDTRRQTEVIPYGAHLNNTGPRQLSDVEPYLYEHPATAGWGGEKLVPYVTDESTETGETGYVYRLAWDSAADAEEFQQKWLELMEYQGAQPVDSHQNTYRIPDDSEYGDAFFVTQNEEMVTIVNGPTVEELSQIEDGAAPPAPQDDDEETNGNDSSDGEMEGDTTETETETETDDGGGPGFTLGLALIALLAGTLAAVRRQQ